MNKILPLVVFSIFVIAVGYENLTFATNHLTVSNIGSSGEDGVSGNIGSSGEDGVNANTVPPWIKTSMQFWIEGQTSDAEFLNAVEFLANERIIHVDAEVQGGTVLEEIEVEKEVDKTSVPLVSAQSGGNTSGTWDTEILSMDLSSHDSFFDIFYETYTVDSFFDVFTEMQESTDSFFDVFFEVETPRTNECLRGQELVFDERTSSWQCASANTVDSFFDVFFDVATDTEQNTEDIDELERKIAVLEKKIAELESKDSDTRPPT